MRSSTAVEPDCTGRCTWLQSEGLWSMASMMSLTKSRGCEVVKRTRRMPGTCADVAQQRGEIPAGGRRIAITVHVLAEQLDLGIAVAGQLPRFAMTESEARLRSGPRVNGTTQ